MNTSHSTSHTRTACKKEEEEEQEKTKEKDSYLSHFRSKCNQYNFSSKGREAVLADGPSMHTRP
jgi:hypothetical protein